ncbi:hypothetical protein KAJ27_14580 [bacterium]|nr:hypothetical protein [bacterium]
MTDCNKIEILSEELISNEQIDQKQLKILFSHLSQCETCFKNFCSAREITFELRNSEKSDFGFINQKAPKKPEKWYRKTAFHSAVALFAVMFSGFFAIHIYTFNNANNHNRIKMLTKITESLISNPETKNSTFWKTEDYYDKKSSFDTTTQETILNNNTKEKFNNEKSVFDDYSYSSYF